MYLVNCCSDLKSGFHYPTSEMSEEHFKLKNEFSDFWVKHVFDRKSQIPGISLNLCSNLWISRF